MRKLIQCVQNDNKNVSVEETIKAIKKAGFDGVFLQWYDKDLPFSQEKQLKLCKELGLAIEFCHLGYKGINNIWLEGVEGENLTNQYLNDLDNLSNFGVKMVCMHLTSKSEAPTPCEIGLKRLKKVVEYAKTKDIKVAFENTKIWGYLEYVFDNLDYDNMGVCYDSGHCHCHFNDKFSWDQFKNKIFAVHLHNNDQTDDLHLLPFDKKGTIDWKELDNHLKEANYNGSIILESCYRYHYLEQSLEDFYKESQKEAKELRKMFDTKQGKLYLTSGGFLDGQRGPHCDKIIIDACANKKVMFVDNATLTGSNVKGIANILGNFNAINAHATQTTLTKYNLQDVFNYDTLYITGGDCTPLIELVNSSDLKEVLLKYLKNGGIIIGESAGSMIFGKDLKWSYDVKKGTKPKYDVVLPTYQGLGFADVNFFPHWNKASEELKTKAQNYEKEHKIKITRVCDDEFIEIKF